MRIDILTLFPEMFDAPLGKSIIGRARDKGLLEIACHQIRDYTENRQNQVDDYPYGGGQGCVMQAQPLYSCWQDVRSQAQGSARTIYFSPQGKVFTQADAKRLLADYDRLILVCGHYEGVDQRFLDLCVDEEISMGDFVLTGGEIPAMALTDAVCRMVPGVLSDQACFTDESHWSGLLEYPHYSRPETWECRPVPQVLLSGDHGAIGAWRKKQALLNTLVKRPDMFSRLLFTKAELKLIGQLKAESDDPSVRAVLDRLHTDRITVRQTAARDLPGLSKLRRAQGVPMDDGALSRWIETLETGQTVHFSLYAEGCGYCGEARYTVTGDGTATLDIWLMPHARGKGIGVFSLAAVIDHAFARPEVTLCTLPEGLPSTLLAGQQGRTDFRLRLAGETGTTVMTEITLGLDIGGTNAKAAILDRDNTVRYTLLRNAKDPSFLPEVTDFITTSPFTLTRIAATGLGAAGLGSTLLGMPVERVVEFTAIGGGALHLAELDEAVVVSMGTGTAFVHAKGDEHCHIIGSGVGGGTVMGLGTKITQAPDIQHMIALAASGDRSQVDLTIGEATGGSHHGLIPELTASNLASVKPSATDADWAQGAMNLVLEAVGTMGILCSRICGTDNIVLTGALAGSAFAQQVYSLFSRFYKLNFIVPENAAYATAVGAALAHDFGKSMENPSL